MQVTEGLIERVERRAEDSKKDPSKKVYFVDVMVDGNLYSGFADFGPKCAGMIDQLNRKVHIDWEAFGSKRDIKAWAFMSIKELKGEDNSKLSDRELWIIKQNVHTAACAIVAARIQAKLITTPDYAATKSEIDAYYLDGLARLGVNE